MAGKDGGRGGLAGTIDSVDGDTIVLELFGNSEMTVKVSDDAKVVVQQEGSVDDLAEGDEVILRGTYEDEEFVAEGVRVLDAADDE
jgi:preprotein translocase subunit YajC